MRVLVCGVGNVLRGDDAFGVRAAEALTADPRLPAEATVIETGIGGIHLVQELMGGYDALILFDAVDRKEEPGKVSLLQPDLPDIDTLTAFQRRDFFCDVHYATPIRALTLAREVSVLPPVVLIVGCQSAATDTYGIGMHPSVEAAIRSAVDMALQIMAGLSIQAAANPSRS